MIEIITRILEIEHLASDAYFQSAKYFQDDTKLATFLNRIAEDEDWHCHVMDSALEHYRGMPPVVPAVTIDQKTDERVRSAFHEICVKLSANELTKEFLFQQILFTEYSEWNDMFLYVVNTLKKKNQEFMHAAARIQGHKRSIEYFFENMPIACDLVANLKTLPSVWDEKILIIEDDDGLSELIQTILHQEGKIDIAINGLEGLEKIKKQYYKLIISDIDMPKMDGLTCYKHAAKIFPNINERFLFFSGNPLPEIQSFLAANHLSYLQKPSPINTIRDHALQILLKHEKNKSPNAVIAV